MANSRITPAPARAPSSFLQEEPLDVRLLAIIADVLGLERASIHLLDSFMELGGDEQSAMRLQRACMTGGINVKTKDILRCQTLAELQTCITPCAGQSSSRNLQERLMVAPLEIHKATRPPNGNEEEKSRPRPSSHSSVSSNYEPKTELEEALSSQGLVSQVTTTNPKAGLLEGKTVVFFSLVNSASGPSDAVDISLVPSSQMLLASTQIATLRRFAEASLGGRPMPDVWVALDQMPLTETGEVSQRRLRTWAQNINEERYRQIMHLNNQQVTETSSVNMEWAARPQNESVHFGVAETLQSTTLASPAPVSQRGELVRKWEEEDSAWFDLAPMQKLYFLTSMGGDARRRAASKAGYRFNQSHLLLITKPCAVEDIRAAIEALVGHHPMLRCRFADQDGEWSQRILPSVSGSYAFGYHSVSSDDEVKAVIARAQASIDIRNGPIFSVDYFQTNDGQQLIYLLAHHLAVDLLSWRIIIHDLDELLDNGCLLSQRSMPYHKWVDLHRSTALDSGLEGYRLPRAVGQSYWGLKDVSNSYEDSLETSFSLDAELTSDLQSTCNLAFQTDPADIFLASLALSFSQTFRDRSLPIVWSQEHGRTSSVPEVDVSETVGWFASLTPLLLELDCSDSIIDVLRKLKDSRRMSQTRGSAMFASGLDTPESKGLFCLDGPFEVVFSHVGSLDQLQRSGGILEQISIPGQALTSPTSDIGPTVGRIAVFEVNTVVEEGVAKVRFVYNRCSKHQDRISTWISNFEHLLLEAIGRLKYHAQELTLSDVPYLDVTYDGLKKLNKSCINFLKLSSVRDVEAVYPVTAYQQHVLVSQAQRPESNIIRFVVEFVAPKGETIDISRLCKAWQLVTARHAALRTVFGSSVTQTGLYDQIVLRRASADMLFIDNFPPDDPIEELGSLPRIGVMEARPAHRLAVCKTPTTTLLNLEISAAVCDTASVKILFQELVHTYSIQKAIPAPVQFSYPDYIQMLKTTREGRSLKHWTDLLATTQPCLLPGFTTSTSNGHLSNVHIELSVLSQELTTFARSQNLADEAILQLAWALVLKSFTGKSDTCFGYSTSGREQLGLGEAVGSFSNTIPCAVNLVSGRSITSTLQTIDEALKTSLPHQFVSIPEVQHALGIKGGHRLFNTSLSYTEETAYFNSESIAGVELELRPLLHQHCTSFDFSLHVRHHNGKLVLDASSLITAEKQTLNVANAFGVAVQAIITSDNRFIGDISLLSDRDYAQIVAWNNGPAYCQLGRDIDVVHDLIIRHADQEPQSQAVCAWDGDLTYQQMADSATKLAHYLVDIGVGPHSVVPLVLEKSRWVPVAMVAVLKTGGAFVLVAAEESGSIQLLENLDAKVAIASGQVASVLGDLFENVIVLNDDLFLQIPHWDTALPSIAVPDGTVCILLTPTSAKDVRGITYSHQAISIAFQAQGPAAKITAESRVMQVSSFNSHIALSEILTTLIHGGCVCIPSPSQRLQNYATDVQRMRVNWSYMTPFLARKLDPALVPSLKVVCFRTRGLDEDTYSAWAGRANVVLAYGPPEVCPLGISFLEVVDPSDLRSIGRPCVGSFLIVNPENRQQLMPVGAVGELVFEGPTVGTEYSGTDVDQDPSEEIGTPTKERCFNARKNRVRYLEDGVIQCVSDDLEDLEIDGDVIRSSEIERNIRRCLGQGVDLKVEAMTFPGEDTPVLAVFVELGDRLFNNGEGLVNPSLAIKETVYMAKQLVESGLKNITAPHLVPSIIVPVRHLPVASSLDVDRQHLRTLVHGMSREQLEALAATPHSTNIQAIDLKPLPLTQTEESVRAILARVLGVEPAVIGPTDGFFDVGGDEVLAAKLVVACRHEGITVSIADVLKNTTLTELCRSMTSGDDSTLPEPYLPPKRVPTTSEQRSSASEVFIEKFLAPKLGVGRKYIKEVAHASAMQTRYIEAGMLRGRANIDYFTFTFSGGINESKLEEACQMLGIIHPILRTAFTPYNRRVYQAVLRSFTVEFERHSCPSWSLSAATKKMIRKDQLSPIAFNKPLTKFIFLDGGKQSTLILRLSKAQYDDFSVALLVKDLKRLYDDNNNPPRRPSYCEFMKSIEHGNINDGQRYWQSLLEGARLTQVVEHSSPYRLTARVMTLRKKMLVGSMSNLGISFETVLKSAWAMVLASLSASSDIVFGEIIDGRHVRLQGGHSVASVMGPAINTIPVRIQFPDAHMSPLELLQYVHGQRIAGIPFENMGFLEVVERCTLWPYWTRLSTVVQHQHEETTIKAGEPKTFHLGSASCVFDVVEPEAQDLPDLFVHSIMRGQGKVELGLTFGTDRVPEDLAEHALRLLCETVNMLTSVSIMQPIIPSAREFRSMQKRIPVRPETSHASSLSSSSYAPHTPNKDEHVLSHLLPPPHAHAIQKAILKAWTTTLHPSHLGVPEDQLHRAAFYDLWGSLIPAAQLAAILNRSLPKLGLPGLSTPTPLLFMEDIIDHPTMLAQFHLITAKAAAAAASPAPPQPRSSPPSSVSGRSKPAASVRQPRPRKKSPASTTVTASATVAKGLRRLASTLARSSAAPTAGPAAPPPPPPVRVRPAAVAEEKAPPPPPPPPQLPCLPAFAPFGTEVVAGDVAADGAGCCGGGAGPGNGGSPGGAGSAESLAGGSGSCASSRPRSGAGEGAGGVGLSRGVGAVRTRGFPAADGAEEVVSPLSAGSGRGGRFWERSGGGSGVDGGGGAGGKEGASDGSRVLEKTGLVSSGGGLLD